MKVWVEDSARAELIKEAEKFPDKETGGALMGFFAETGGVVTHVIGPGPGAFHGKTSFQQDNEWVQEMIDHHYMETGRTETYLGDWHTHPGGSGYLSDPDRKVLRIIARKSWPKLPIPLMLILCGGSPWEFKAWTTRRGFFPFWDYWELPVCK
jgi:integrative and conjugative element protein (TIGR02256 family)